MNRRELILSAAAALASADKAHSAFATFQPGVTFGPYLGNPTNISVGAIRWDAWQHPTVDVVRGAIEASLGPYQYHARVPFFGTVTGLQSVTIAGDQDAMDAEILHAVVAGLDYWAFLRYGSFNPAMDQGFTYFQASPNKALINWCLYFPGPGYFVNEVNTNLAALVAFLQQSNYQKVHSSRPLVLCFDDGNPTTGLAAAITAFRSAVTGAGVANPYMAYQQPVVSGPVLASFGFDATTLYAWTTVITQPTPFSSLGSSLVTRWQAQVGGGVECVPLATMGWDTRPRAEHPVPWQPSGGSLTRYWNLDAMNDIGVHLDNMLAWVRANPTENPANTLILYAWNEHDEGGFICPTLFGNTQKRDVLARVLVP